MDSTLTLTETMNRKQKQNIRLFKYRMALLLVNGFKIMVSDVSDFKNTGASVDWNLFKSIEWTDKAKRISWKYRN